MVGRSSETLARSHEIGALVSRTGAPMRTALAVPMLVLTAASSAFAWGDPVTGNGDIATETRKVTEFTAIDGSGGVKITVKKGDPSLSIETDRNLLELVVTEVKDGRLHIGPKRNTQLRPTKSITVSVTVPSLTDVGGSGGVTLDVDAPVTKSARIDLSGGVNAHINAIDADSLKIDASGGVEMTLTGKAVASKVDLSGGVQVHAAKLSLKTMSVDASGGCAIDVAVADAVHGEISGGVDLQLHGSPKVSVSKSGGASVRVRD